MTRPKPSGQPKKSARIACGFLTEADTNAIADGTITRERASEVKPHVRGCESCRRALQGIVDYLLQMAESVIELLGRGKPETTTVMHLPKPRDP